MKNTTDMTEKEIEKIIATVGCASRERSARELLSGVVTDASLWGRRVTALRRNTHTLGLALLTIAMTYYVTDSCLPDEKMCTSDGYSHAAACALADDIITTLICA